MPQRRSRRAFLRASAGVPAALLLLACGDDEPPPSGPSPSPAAAGADGAASATTGTRGVVLQPTPACGEQSATIAQTEGPYFKPSSPQRTNLVEQGMAGTRLTLSGSVLSTDCRPVANALLDFWQADAGGQYDNNGFRLRGHQFTDGSGRYQLQTVVPGLYPGRTFHVHVKVQAPRGPVLTTQLYFPEAATQNRQDGIFRPELLMAVQEAAGVKTATYDFVVKA